MKVNKIVVLLLVLVTVPAVALAAAWSTKRLTNNSVFSGFPSIAVDGSNVYVVYEDYTPGNGELYFRKSTDGGTTWQAPRRLTRSAGDSWNPVIAVDGDNVCVAWDDNSVGNKEIYFRRSADGGTNWEAAKRLTNNSGDSQHPALAIQGTNVYVVWDNATTETPDGVEIFIRKSSDGGATWNPAKRLTNNSVFSGFPALAVDAATGVYVLYEDYTPGNGEIYMRKSTDSGNTWQRAKRLTRTSKDSWGPVLAVNGTDLYMTWFDNTPGAFDIYFLKSADGGATWKAPKKITNNAGNSVAPSIGISGSHIYLAWFDDTTGNNEIYFRQSNDGGTTWQRVKIITATSGTSENPQIACNSTTVYVVYDDDTPGEYEVYLKYSVP